jgi:hypothetical protein
MAAAFGTGMLTAPGAMLANMARDTPDARLVLQWMGVALLSVGLMNILARTDPGSRALQALMLGNIVMHGIGFAIDVYHHAIGFVQTSGVITGGVVHGVLAAGFLYYLPTSQSR